MATDTATADPDTYAEGLDDGVDVEIAPGGPRKMDLTVEVEDSGPCLKHVTVTVPRAELDLVLEEEVGGYADEA